MHEAAILGDALLVRDLMRTVQGMRTVWYGGERGVQINKQDVRTRGVSAA